MRGHVDTLCHAEPTAQNRWQCARCATSCARPHRGAGGDGIVHPQRLQNRAVHAIDDCGLLPRVAQLRQRSRDAQRCAAKGAQGLGHCAAVCHYASLRCHWQTLPHWLVGHFGADWLGLLGVGSALSAHTLTPALHPLRMGCRGAALHHQRPRWHHSRAVFQSQHILAVLAWWLDSPCAGDVGHGGIAPASPHGHQRSAPPHLPGVRGNGYGGRAVHPR